MAAVFCSAGAGERQDVLQITATTIASASRPTPPCRYLQDVAAGVIYCCRGDDNGQRRLGIGS